MSLLDKLKKVAALKANEYLDPSTMPSAGPIGPPPYDPRGTLDAIEHGLPVGVSLADLAAEIIRKEVNIIGELATGDKLKKILGKASSDVLGASLLSNGVEGKPPVPDEDTDLQKRIKAKLKGMENK